VEPIIWNSRTGNIVGGHQRFKILVALGYEDMECVVLDINDQKEKALNVALNKISGEFDIPLLTDLLKDIGASGFGISITGFDAADMDVLFKDSVVAGIKGYGKQGIANRLNEMGVSTRFGKEWHEDTIRKILQNEKYVGDMLLHIRTSALIRS